MSAMELDAAPAGNRKSGFWHGGADHPKNTRGGLPD
jgi:hypothetical protein